MSEKKFYLTTPIYYVNARPHIGHAYTTIVADVLARRHRLLGDDTFFLTGTDEHGQKIERSAAAAGIPPQQFADQVSKSFEDLWKRMGILRDTGDPLFKQDYIRTTDPRHKRGVQKLFATLYERGFIELRNYTGAYCVSDETFVDAPAGTPCPDCGRLLETVTEENFFFKLSEFQLPLLDLIESNTLLITPESRRNEVLSFLRGNIGPANSPTNSPTPDASSRPEAASSQPEGLSSRPEAKGRSGEIPAFEAATTARTAANTPYVPGALKDLSISRSSFTWGIPVPEPAASAAAQKHVIYVWLDALANYMTAIGYGSDDPAEQAKFEKYWPADLHLVGKEIIRFHCIYWPAFLLALNPEGAQTPGAPGPDSGTWVSTEAQGPQLTFDQHKAWAEKWLPKQVTAHGWLLFEDSKMSKSRGNIVRTETILDAFGTLYPPPTALKGTGFSPSAPIPSKDAALAAEGISSEPTKAERDLFASDVLRYFLLREIPFGQDGSFSFDALLTRYNADLANGYGNLVSRTLKMIEQYFGGRVSPSLDELVYNSYTAAENAAIMAAIAFSQERLATISKSIDSPDFAGALANIQSLIKWTDDVLSSATPWKERESEDITLYTRTQILYQAAESIRIITALLYPILPFTTARVWAQLGLGDIELAARNGELNNLEWGGLKPGTKLGPLTPIFPRADKGLAQIMTDMETPTPQQPEAEPTSTTDPAAPPRTTSLNEPTGPLTVGGSSAHTSGPNPTPSHAEIPASGIFANQPAPPTTDTPQITIDDFAKIELRVAQILVAERIPKADKLLRLEVDLGYEKRQILSGIAEWYTPEDLIGRRIVVITNLAPRKMRGLESHGMLLAASHGENGKPVLATFAEDIALGSRLK